MTQEQLHILIIPAWFSRNRSDGIFIREHARMVKSQGHAVGIIYVGRASPFQEFTERWTEEGIQISLLQKWHLPKAIGMIGMWKRQYADLYRAYVAEHGIPDIVHAHGYLAGMAARAINSSASIPYVITEHSTNIPAQRVAWYHRRELRLAYRDAAALVAVSEFLKTAMKPWAGSAEISVISNPVDFQKFTLSVHPKQHDKKQLITIGSLISRKDLPTLLKACAKPGMQNVTLKIIGAGDQFEHLRQLEKRLGLAHRITWTGHQTSSEIAGHLLHADIYVSSSRLETFGVTLVEALASGIPVVTTRSGAPEEYIRENTGRVVPAGDSDALAVAIREVVENLNDFDTGEIRTYARSKFDFPVIGGQIDALYLKTLGVTAE